MKKQPSAVRSSARACASAFLSVVLVSGLFPAQVFAANAEGSAEEAVRSAVVSAAPATESASSSAAAATEPASFYASASTADPSADPTSAADAMLTAGWNQLGTCEWRIDGAGLLTIRPLGNGASGVLNSWRPDKAPWKRDESLRTSITSVVIEPGVVAETCFHMFSDCTNLVSVDLSGLDTPQVTDMTCMFYGCAALKTVNFQGVDASNVTSMSSMFNECSSIKSIDLSGINAARVTNIHTLFNNCFALESVDISSFTGSAIPDAVASFAGATLVSQLTLPAGLDLTDNNTDACLRMSSMGVHHDSRWVDTAGTVYGSNEEMLWANIGRISGAETYTTTDAMPSPEWTQSGGCEWKIDDDGLLTVRPLPGYGKGALPDWQQDHFGAPWSERCKEIISARFEQGVVAKTCLSLFAYCNNLTSVDFSGLDLSGVTDMHNMFECCTSLTSIDLSDWSFSPLVETYCMFESCTSLTDVTLPAGVHMDKRFADEYVWMDTTGALYETTAQVAEANANRTSGAMTYTTLRPTEGWERSGTCEWRVYWDDDFYGPGFLEIRPLPGLTQGVLDDWGEDCEDVPWYRDRESIEYVRISQGVAARTCYSMFADFTRLESVMISELDTSRVADMRLMFANCDQLETIFASKLAIKQVTQSEGMFAGCTALEGGEGTVFDASFTDASRARVDNGAAAPGYFIGSHAELDGDVSGNGALNIVDAQIAYDMVKSPETYADRADYESMYSRADVKWNNDVDATNAFAIQRAALCGWDD